MGFKKRARDRQPSSNGLNDSRVRKRSKTLWDMTDEEYIAKRLATECGRITYNKEKVSIVRKRVKEARRKAFDRFAKNPIWNSPSRFSAVMETAIWGAMESDMDFANLKTRDVSTRLAESVTGLTADDMKLGSKPKNITALWLKHSDALEEFREVRYMFELTFEAIEAIMLGTEPTKRSRLVHDYLTICSPDARCLKCSVFTKTARPLFGEPAIIINQRYLRLKRKDSEISRLYYKFYRGVEAIKELTLGAYNELDDPLEALWVSSRGHYHVEYMEKALLKSQYFDDKDDIRTAIHTLMRMDNREIDLLLNDISVVASRKDQYIQSSAKTRLKLQRMVSLLNALMTGASNTKLRIRTDKPIPIKFSSKNLKERMIGKNDKLSRYFN